MICCLSGGFMRVDYFDSSLCSSVTISVFRFLNVNAHLAWPFLAIHYTCR